MEFSVGEDADTPTTAETVGPAWARPLMRTMSAITPAMRFFIRFLFDPCELSHMSENEDSVRALTESLQSFSIGILEAIPPHPKAKPETVRSYKHVVLIPGKHQPQ